MPNARKTAIEILSKILNENAYSNIITGEILAKSGLDERNSAFCSRLVLTALERKLTLDYNLSLYLDKPLRKLNPTVYLILLTGSAQLLFMDKVPESAAVNESVKLANICKVKYASGLINAVLRKICTNKLIIPENNLSIKYSFPENTVKYLINILGLADAEKFMEGTFLPQKNKAQPNTIKNPDGECFEFSGNPRDIDGFEDGKFFVQGDASALCVRALSPNEGDTVLDACAAPGGKSFNAACLMANKGKIFSCDIHEHKLRLIDEGAKRLNIDIIETRLCDATDENNSFMPCDRVLCDVPCSGLGEIAKKPEIKYKDIFSFDDLPEIQYKILENCSRFVKKGGTLVYSTCTIRPEENRNVTEKFLANHSDFEKYPVDLPEFQGKNELTLLSPEGFYICRMRRRENERKN